MGKKDRNITITGNHSGGVHIAGDIDGGVVISGDSGDAVVVSGKRKGGTTFAGTIDANGATVIMNSNGAVHHGSGTQINIRSKKK